MHTLWQACDMVPPHGLTKSTCRKTTRKHDSSPHRTVDLSPLNKYYKREIYAAKSPFYLAHCIPKDTWKTVIDAWNGYHSIPLHESQGVKCPIFSYFLKNSYFFLFFTKIPIFPYFSGVFFFLTFILLFAQKLKEASKIRRISCLGKSHSCEIASLWSFPPK